MHQRGQERYRQLAEGTATEQAPGSGELALNQLLPGPVTPSPRAMAELGGWRGHRGGDTAGLQDLKRAQSLRAECPPPFASQHGAVGATAAKRPLESPHANWRCREARAVPAAPRAAAGSVRTCTAITDKTSTEMRLNSSKQPQAPVWARPL